MEDTVYAIRFDDDKIIDVQVNEGDDWIPYDEYLEEKKKNPVKYRRLPRPYRVEL